MILDKIANHKREEVAQALAGQAEARRFLLAEATKGWDVLVDALEAAGSLVDQIAVYDRVDVEAPNPDVVSALSSGDVDWVTVTSSATARSLVRLYGDALRHAHIASLSPLTSSALRDLGYEPAAEAFPHTTAGLVDAILGVGRADSCRGNVTGGARDEVARVHLRSGKRSGTLMP